MTKTYFEDAGKGCKQRRSEVSKDTYASNWDAIFGKKKVEVPCRVCHGEGGCMDAGWWYDCPACRKE